MGGLHKSTEKQQRTHSVHDPRWKFLHPTVISNPRKGSARRPKFRHPNCERGRIEASGCSCAFGSGQFGSYGDGSRIIRHGSSQDLQMPEGGGGQGHEPAMDLEFSRSIEKIKSRLKVII
ncbi:unnamed protein product [Linum trigynum]|uniref:Uncharacterized protein n=1 Tax=Linum trigynum TaxID=586398 RepID=A0AAV2C6U1_9ROSI